MLSLKAVPYTDVSKWMVDFQKRSRSFDMPPDTAQSIGIFQDDELIGYFMIQGYDNTIVEISQGYLRPQYRHFDLPKECMRILETQCKTAGYKKMVLATGSRFKAYFKFAKSLGYKPMHLEFIKSLEGN